MSDDKKVHRCGHIIDRRMVGRLIAGEMRCRRVVAEPGKCFLHRGLRNDDGRRP